MSNIEPLDIVLKKSLLALGEDFYKRFLKHVIFRSWEKIVGKSIASNVRPLRLEHETLFVYSSQSVWRDYFKYEAENVVNAINKFLDWKEELVKDIKMGRSYEIPKNFYEEPKESKSLLRTSSPYTLEGDLQKINLSNKEIKKIELSTSNIKNMELRLLVFNTMISHAKFEKLKILNGWHGCVCCKKLCAPAELFCDVCKFKIQEEMRQDIRKIFLDVPDSTLREVYNEILKIYPFMKNYLTIEIISSEKSSLIQRLASKISIDDADSIDAKILVMLKKGVSPENLTEKLIQKTLYELRYNLLPSDKLKKFGRYSQSQKTVSKNL